MRIITYKDKRYELVQEPYQDGYGDYVAPAICVAHTPDAAGWQTLYTIIWAGGEQGCDWDNPVSIKENGRYNKTQQRFA